MNADSTGHKSRTDGNAKKRTKKVEAGSIWHLGVVFVDKKSRLVRPFPFLIPTVVLLLSIITDCVLLSCYIFRTCVYMCVSTGVSVCAWMGEVKDLQQRPDVDAGCVSLRGKEKSIALPLVREYHWAIRERHIPHLYFGFRDRAVIIDASLFCDEDVFSFLREKTTK